jgi:signal transduction histidine kinase/CheY-like chemotaxis protein
MRHIVPRSLGMRLLLGTLMLGAAVTLAANWITGSVVEPAATGRVRLVWSALSAAGFATVGLLFWRATRRLTRAAEYATRTACELLARTGGAALGSGPGGNPGGEARRLTRTIDALAGGVLATLRDREVSNRRLQSEVQQRTSELRQKNLALAFQNEKVTETNRLKSAFFANVSHELRTPLNAILALTDMLREEIPGPLNDEQRKHLTLTYNSGVKLLDLINDVLDLSRIEAGRMDVQREEAPIVDLLRGASEELRPLAREKGIELVLQTQGDGRRVRVDATKVRQVFVNLLGNAIKFTEHGEITARVQLLGDESLLSVEVEDTGPGIPLEEQQRIFLEFHRVEGAAGPRPGGTGLGLAISKRLVHLMSGDIWVDSSVGRGSRFAFVIPLDEGTLAPGAGEAAEIAEPTPPADDPSSLERRRVLVVAQDRLEAGVLGRYLRQRGLDIVLVSGEREAQRIFETEPVDLAIVVVSEGELSRSDEWLAWLSRRPERDTLPVVLYASRECPPAWAAMAARSADAFFVKGERGVGELVDLVVERIGAARPGAAVAPARQQRAA